MSPRSCIPCPKIENDAYDWYKRHETRCELAKKNSYDIVFIGDSITHFWADEDGVTHGVEVWREYYGRRRVLNLGFGFDRTQNVLWRLEHGELDGQCPKLVVLNIGANQFSATPNYPCDTSADAAEGIKAVIARLRAMFPETELIVMAVLPRGTKEMEYREKISETNAIVREYAKTLPHTEYLDLSARFTYPDGSLKRELYRDCLTHLTPAGYRIWAEALEPRIRHILKED